MAFSPKQSLPAVATSNELGPPPSTEHLVAGYSDGTLRVFDVGKVQMVRKMHPHASPVKAVAYSVNGKECISQCCIGACMSQ